MCVGNLNSKRGDQICYRTEASSRVYIEPAQVGDTDLALGAFLDFIEADVMVRPDCLWALGGPLHERLAALVADMDADIGAPLSPDDK